MKILVCTKEIPELDIPLEAETVDGRVKLTGTHKYFMNKPDEFAIEEALLIKEEFPGTKVDVLTAGSENASRLLERAMGMGADNGIHIIVQSADFLNPLSVASWIAAYASCNSYDLIFTGVMADDDMQGQVGPMVAELLSIPCATSVIHEEIISIDGIVYVEREIEGGLRDMVELSLPALLTIQTGINRPRYPSLSNLLRARHQKVLVVNPDELPALKPKEHIYGVSSPTMSRKGVILQGTHYEKAKTLFEILKSKAYF